MGEVATIGLDLAKNVFQVHGIDAVGNVLVRRQLRRAEVLEFFAKIGPCLVGMEACATAPHWARAITRLGHRVKLLPPAYVKPYVKRGKTDAADAEAIAEAVTRPTMRFVAVKTAEQQSALTLHKARDLLVRQRTALLNALRGHMGEFGIIAPQGAKKVAWLIEVLHTAAETIPDRRHGARRAPVRLGAPVRGMARSNATAQKQRWQGAPGAHQPAGQSLRATPAGHRGDRGDPLRQGETRS